MERRKPGKTSPSPSATGSAASSNPVEEAHFRASLRIDKYSLDADVSQQPDTYGKVCDRLAHARSLADEAVDRHDKMEAELFLEYRHLTPKPTESEAKAMVQVDVRRDATFKAMVEAKRVLNEWQGLEKAFEQRRWMLHEMCVMQERQMGSTGSVPSNPEARRRYAESEENRRAIAEMRRSRDNGMKR